MLVGGRGEELMNEGRQRKALAALIGIALALHLGSAIGLDRLTRRLQRPRLTCPNSVTSAVGSRVTLSAEATGVASIRDSRWRVVTQPANSFYRFIAPHANPTTFTGMNSGQYELEYSVNDTLGRASACTVQVTLSNEVELEAPPPPPPVVPIPEPVVPTPEPPRPVERHVDRTPPPANTPPQQQAAPPPAPTEAAPIMTVEDEFSNEQEAAATGHNVNATGDVANNGVRRGPGEGVSGAQAGGTGTGPARAGTNAPAAAPAIDYASHVAFHCDESAMRDEFPDAAREAGIMDMTITLTVTVDANGRITTVRPTNDPGYGFVAAATAVVRRHCEITPARDRSGAPVSETKRQSVHFMME